MNCYHRDKAMAKAASARRQAASDPDDVWARTRRCSWVIGRAGVITSPCGAPAKMAGGRPYCADHFPAVVS